MSKRIALITGGSRGIGKSLAYSLAADGFDLSLVARSTMSLEPVVQAITEKYSVQVLPIACDLSDPDDIPLIVEKTTKTYGRIDLLVNNAGVGGKGTLEVTVEKFDELYSVNLRAPFILMKHTVPVMLDQGSGMVVNISSRAGKIGFEEWGAYGAGKFGLVGLTDSVYRELAKKGIKVTTICPGWTDTDMARDGGNADTDFDQMIKVDDIAETIRWLLKLSPTACIREIFIDPRGDVV